MKRAHGVHTACLLRAPAHDANGPHRARNFFLVLRNDVMHVLDHLGEARLVALKAIEV